MLRPHLSMADFPELTPTEASRLARLPLEGLEREYPNNIVHLLEGPDDVASPKELHPAFYGSYDWHSSVHGHWMLIRLLKKFPDLPEGERIRAILHRNLSAANIEIEAAYFSRPQRKSFERPYGWGWLLKMAEELHTWDDPQAQEWAKNLGPMVEVIVQHYRDFFPRQTYPIRSGVHNNTALGLTFGLDYARATQNRELEALIVERSHFYYGQDKDFPARWEPGGDHFLSPALTEADLMRRVLPPKEFQDWFQSFLPGIESGEPKSLLHPAEVSDRSDPKIVHLDGLNFSRAWAMLGVAQTLAEDDPRKAILVDSATVHGTDALSHVASGDYAGEHWLASFAVYMLSVR
jgi:Protein of unknown function (DUF2891)